MRQLVKFGEPIWQDVYAEEYLGDENGNLYAKTGKRIKVDRMCVGYDFSKSKWQEEEKPLVEFRVGIKTKQLKPK